MWTVKDVAKYLNVSVRQVSVLREKHGLPFRKVGNMVRFYPDEVEAWVNSKR